MKQDITSKEDPARTYLDQLIEIDRMPGIQYLAVDDQEVRFEHIAGKGDIGSNLSVTLGTTFMQVHRQKSAESFLLK